MVIKMEFYDGTKLLSLKDINGKTPEIYICVSNRSAGKTTYFGRYFVNRFIKCGEKFALIYRFADELDNVADKFFSDLHALFFPAHTMTEVKREKGAYIELKLNEETCGYAVALNSADKIKKFSHLMSGVERMLFDEFQSETGRYAAKEVQKFISIHASLARGRGKQSRYLPVVMLSNMVSLLNPYYTEFGISARLREETKFLRGDGFVLEQSFNESAATAQKESAFNRAFQGNKQIDYLTQRVYLNDRLSFIEQPTGVSRYVCTIKFNGKLFGIREFLNEGIVHCSTKADPSFPMKIAVTTDDHQVNFVMLNAMRSLIMILREYFERGVFRFSNLEAKEALMSAISY